jgi:hypothetical protein
VQCTNENVEPLDSLGVVRFSAPTRGEARRQVLRILGPKGRADESIENPYALFTNSKHWCKLPRLIPQAVKSRLSVVTA